MMNRRLITTVTVGGLLFSVYALRGTLQEQTTDATQSGITPNRNCTCPMRLDDDFARDAGLGLYRRVTFPCRVTVLPDAGRDVQMPPMPTQRARDAIDVVDWTDCQLAASTQAVADRWGMARPFVLVGAAQRPWCRAKEDAGLPCLRLLPDGGSFSFGDRNVFPCVQAVAPATCERVSGGSVYAGDDPEGL